jgi:hypothetical protein
MAEEFKIGDKFYSVWQQSIFTLITEDFYVGEPAFNIHWQKYDDCRMDLGQAYDGTVTVEWLKSGELCNKAIYKIIDDNHLLYLRLKHGF